MGTTAMRIAVIAVALAASGCATNNPKDPFEPFNRAMFSVNDTVDRVALKPTAQAYSKLPSFVQTGVGNFFGNLADVWTGINNLLQGKGADGVTDLMRVGVNTTFGLGGLIDIGSQAGMTRHREDFGQTLGKWGVTSGPYLVLPILGPSTLRDTVVTPLDIAADPWHYKRPVRWRSVGSILRAVDQRAAVLDASNLLEDAALDRYEFVRDAYLQRRESKVRDGETQSSSYEEDFAPATAQDGANWTKKTAEPMPASIIKKEPVDAAQDQR